MSAAAKLVKSAVTAAPGPFSLPSALLPARKAPTPMFSRDGFSVLKQAHQRTLDRLNFLVSGNHFGWGSYPSFHSIPYSTRIPYPSDLSCSLMSISSVPHLIPHLISSHPIQYHPSKAPGNERFMNVPLLQVMHQSVRNPDKQPLFNHASFAWNNDFFVQCLGDEVCHILASDPGGWNDVVYRRCDFSSWTRTPSPPRSHRRPWCRLSPRNSEAWKTFSASSTCIP